jgi:hypothetical protein
MLPAVFAHCQQCPGVVDGACHPQHCLPPHSACHPPPPGSHPPPTRHIKGIKGKFHCFVVCFTNFSGLKHAKQHTPATAASSPHSRGVRCAGHSWGATGNRGDPQGALFMCPHHAPLTPPSCHITQNPNPQKQPQPPQPTPQWQGHHNQPHPHHTPQTTSHNGCCCYLSQDTGHSPAAPHNPRHAMSPNAAVTSLLPGMGSLHQLPPAPTTTSTTNNNAHNPHNIHQQPHQHAAHNGQQWPWPNNPNLFLSLFPSKITLSVC